MLDVLGNLRFALHFALVFATKECWSQISRHYTEFIPFMRDAAVLLLLQAYFVISNADYLD